MNCHQLQIYKLEEGPPTNLHIGWQLSCPLPAPLPSISLSLFRFPTNITAFYSRVPYRSLRDSGHRIGPMASIDACWQFLITHFSDFQLATFGSFIIHESVFFLSGLPSIYFERTGLFSKYKIQKKNNTPAAQEKCILRLILYHVCVNLPVMIFSYPVFRWMGLKTSLPLPHWSVILSQIVFYFILEDFVFYWGHRVLHTKWLYKHVHSVHHEYATPFGLTSEYAHPAEILFLGFATIVGPALTGPHLFTLWLWMVLRVLETVEAHCGYDFPWSPSKFLPLYGGAEFHDFHHRILYTKSGNYSSTFTYMDRLFGTDTDYRKQRALQSQEGKVLR